MSNNSKIINQVLSDQIIGLENRITFLESLYERQHLSSFTRDTDIIKKLIEVVNLLLIHPDDLSRKAMVESTRVDLEKILRKMDKKRR